MQPLTDSLRREQMRPAGLRIPRIAVLSDQGLYRDGIVEILRQHGFKRVDGFGDCESLLETARAAPLDLTLVDLAHELEDAEDVARRLRAIWPDLTIVAIGTPVQLAARAVGVDGCVAFHRSRGTPTIPPLACPVCSATGHGPGIPCSMAARRSVICTRHCSRSEEHTSELQSPCNLVCRLLL